MSDTAETLATLRKLRNLGVKIAMDDFGIGYSSLGYLQTFPFDKVKIDRSFVRQLGDDHSAAAIVQAVVGMSHALGVHTIAEGVETPSQADLLREEGCQEVQGYMFGRPMSGLAFTAFLPRGKTTEYHPARAAADGQAAADSASKRCPF